MDITCVVPHFDSEICGDCLTPPASLEPEAFILEKLQRSRFN